MLGALDLDRPERWRDRRCYLARYSILHLENIVEFPLHSIGPEVTSKRRIRELNHNPHPAAVLANAAAKRITNSKFHPDLSQVQSAAFVERDRTTGDDEQPREATQGDGDVLHYSFREIVLTGVTAEIGEWKHDDRWLIWQALPMRGLHSWCGLLGFGGAQFANGNDRLGSGSHVQRLEDRGDVLLHCWFGQIERTADRLVALALHHESEHVGFSLRQPKLLKQRQSSLCQ